MGNAQEAIKEYEGWVDHARRVHTKIVTPERSIVTMILDHEYATDGQVKYLCQSDNGHQKWKIGLDEYNYYWVQLTKTYWANQADEQNETPKDMDLDIFRPSESYISSVSLSHVS